MAVWDPQANDLFLEALELRSPAERRAYLAQACGDNAGWRAQAEALLSASERAGSFLEKPPVEGGETVDPLGGAGADASKALVETPGSMIGPYKLLEPIGEGGFGVVFLAEQTQPVRRKVALKVL